MRRDGRRPDQLRPVTFERHFNDRPPGSVLVSYGRTRLLCTAVVEEGVPPFLAGSGQGWLTAEYAMLPASTDRRKAREGRTGKPDSRSLEISRLVGRALRAVVDLRALADRTLWVDCDVLQADGGTRTAAVSGAFVAVRDALAALQPAVNALRGSVAAASVGVVDGEPLLDLDYQEDARASVDLNVVLTGDLKYVEVQGTAESRPFDDAELRSMLALARAGIAEITRLQHAAFEA
jgi:ribonuclease PH